MKLLTKTLIAAAGIFLANCAFAATHYVSIDSSNPVAPFSDWNTAATNIQDAIDASTNGDLVLVTNGTYSTGGISMDGVITNRVTLNKAITVQSVNGLASTIIQGALDPVSTNGPAAIRCAWLTTNAVLIGFTLRGGATGSDDSKGILSTTGGGVLGSMTFGKSPGPTNASVYNCLIESNYSFQAAGGAYRVRLNHCTIMGNQATGSCQSAVSGLVPSPIHFSVSGDRKFVIFYRDGPRRPTVGQPAFDGLQ